VFLKPCSRSSACLDVQVCALKAIAEFAPGDQLQRTKVAPTKPPAILADVVRGVPVSLPSCWNVGREACDERGWGVRVEAADALARWQVMRAPKTGVASLAGAWLGRDRLLLCLADLFKDHESRTPLPLGTRVVRGTAPGSAGRGEFPGAFASASLHVAIIEAIASNRAQNGATPLDSVR